MKLPPVVLACNLFTAENKEIYYPAPLLDLWIKSTQPPHNSPSERNPTHYPPEPSFSSPPAGPNEDLMPYEDFDTRLDRQFLVPPTEKLQNNGQDTEILMDELRTNLDHGLRVPEATPQVWSGKSGGDSIHSFPGSVSEHGLSSNSGGDKGRISKKRHSSSGNGSAGLKPVAENAKFKLARVSEVGDPTPDQELLVETGPTQTQANIDHPNEKIGDSIQAHMKAHFSTPGAPAGMTRKSAAQLFYHTLVLVTGDALRGEQKEPYGDILISRG
ncbi:sister chromatid cohesion 1 protein 1-like isoform X2 [Lotus japonicus]|uniref:sister chromatid cohesion 1 protein 1-like isoform X2 n=1 Tax=Lotus japonicus TaxID=34305 RepID=UPI0025894BD2|nr:sister chromatid cohesion 1 protein 1-like isoform X2 [Lotus japonicus]